MSKEKLQPWRPGDIIEAARLNEIQDIVERHDAHHPSGGGIYSDGFSADRPRIHPQIKFVRMREVIGPAEDVDNQWYNREGTVQSWNPSESDFEDTFEEVRNVVDPEGGHVADRNQIVPCVSHNGKLVAINWTTVRHAITCRDRNNNYPAIGSERVYPIKFVKIEYDETLEPQTIGHSLLYPDRIFNDDYVCNLRDDLYAYIPEGTLIWVYRVTGQWFTFVEGDIGDGTTEHSHSSLSQVESESSTSTSTSSRSTSSQSTSTSSSSTSSSSTSSTSISESSSNYECVDVVTCLSFDEITCILTYEAVRLCFPKSLGIKIEEAEASGC